LQRKTKIAVTTDNRKAIALADVIILAVKPQMLPAVTRDIKETVARQHPLVISIAAGIRMNHLEAWLGKTTAIVRCMPNTPALIGLGASALYANSQVDETKRKYAQAILEAVGVTCWLAEEALLDAVTVISGSGPAYFFLLIEILVNA